MRFIRMLNQQPITLIIKPYCSENTFCCVISNAERNLKLTALMEQFSIYVQSDVSSTQKDYSGKKGFSCQVLPV